MLQQYFGSRKSKLFALAGLILLALLLLGLRIVSLQKAASEVVFEPALKLSYCGAEPEELCVLSFGRDLDEYMVVNIFVPDRKFPSFYLKIKRIAGESVYECEKDKEVPTNVYCYGDMVNLQERMEVSLFSKKEEQLIAVGNFTLRAILISEPSFAEGSGGVSTLEATVDETPTFIGSFNTPVASPTPTQTPDASYPNPSYP